tara:strand:- start:26063 stop:26731 length:669 start_codon:yes stop_codon:yes gene_type:complete
MTEEAIWVGPRKFDVWPKGQKIGKFTDNVFAAVFHDAADYNDVLVKQLVEWEEKKRAETPPQSRAIGGTKFHNVQDWGNPAADLIHARALALFRKLFNTEAAFVDYCWGNVYRAGDFVMPHSHRRCAASLVYCLAEGDEDENDLLAGKFCFVDPRMPACCSQEKHRMTTPAYPGFKAGTMLIFPSELVHFVIPYHGNAPRITMSWNMAETEFPGSPEDAWQK